VGFTFPAFANSGELTLSHYFTGENGLDAFNAQLDKFTKATGIVIKNSPIGHEDYKTDILVRAAGSSLPDVFSYWAGARVQFIVDSNSLHPIDDVWNEANLDAVVSKQVAASATLYNGKRYLIPFDYHVAGFFYNPKVFASVGASTPPKTWDEFLALCKELKAKGIAPIALGSKSRWPAQFWFDYLLLRTAGPEYRAKLMSGAAKYADPEVAAAMAMWKSLLDAGYFAENSNAQEWTEAGDKVMRGEAAMTLMGTWIAGYWNTNGFGPTKDYDFFVMPPLKSGVPIAAVGPVDGFVMSANVKNVPEASKFLEFMMADEDVQSSWANGQGGLSANVKIDPSSYDAIRQKAVAAVAAADVFAFNYDLATPPPVAEVGLSMFAKFIDSPSDVDRILAQASADAEVAFQK
jgi:multiple sugar transport system substrate-binding protein/raffinose/stachyose/melibiose transport system substrate-binding protein